MALLTRQGGIWKDSVPMVKDGGAWKEVSEGYVKDDGVWKKFYGNDGVNFLITSGGADILPYVYECGLRGKAGLLAGIVPIQPYGTISPDDNTQFQITELYEYTHDLGGGAGTVLEVINTEDLNGKTMIMNGRAVTLSGTLSGTTFTMDLSDTHLWTLAGATTIGAQYTVSILL